MITRAAIELSDEQLLAAWREISAWARSWPPTFEAVMADSVRAGLVRLRATQMARRALYPPAPAPAAPASSTTAPAAAPAQPLRASFVPPPGWIDHQRAAAGDRDDD